jgi:FHA domain-containing protein
VHAQVVFRNGGYAVVDRGSNPITVNGRSLGNGQEASLKAGDQLQIGGYALRVDSVGVGASSVPADPFADFAGLAAPAAPAARPVPQPPSSANLDPLAGFGMAPGAPSAGGFGSPTKAAPVASGIPDDWDPFASGPAAKAGPADFARSLGQAPGTAANFGLEVGARGPGALIPDLPASGAGGSADSLDALFGLGPSAGADPLAGSIFAQADALPNMAANADPMKSLNSIARANVQAAAQVVPELNTPFEAVPRRPAPSVAPVAAPTPLTYQSPPAIPGAVLSWHEAEGGGHTVIRPRTAAPVAAAPRTAAPARVAPSVPLPISAAPVAAAPSLPARAAAPGEVEALLAALRTGLGVPTLQIDSLTPELMRLIGQLLHEAARGTVDLLVARAALKREVRAEMTMIVAKENNPLKFSPSVEVALAHLLSPPARGFLSADRAMRDAYDDLRAHQFGFLAGMKAALEGVLKRFDPAVLEARLTHKSVLATLLPATRKAKMWDVFTDLYGQISNEAADDFHELFGKEFLRAYESYIDKLEKDRS